MKKIKNFIIILALALGAYPVMNGAGKPTVKEQVTTNNYKVTAQATHYGSTYKGKRHTANGEVFNLNAMTCAAGKHIPFGAKLKVKNLNNGKEVIVRVTDRGGFAKKRPNDIDLTYGAFCQIAKPSTGRIPVEVTMIN